MTTLCKTYPTPDDAREAAEALQAEGVPARGIHLLAGGTLHDIRREPVGSFAGEVGPDALVGNFGGAVRRRCQPRSAWAGDPGHGRQGSFADTAMADDHEIRVALADAAMTGEAAEQVVEDLHRGHAVVLAKIA